MKKLLKLLNKNVSVGITLNLSYYSILQYISPIPCCSIVLAICKLMFNNLIHAWIFVIALMEGGKS